MSFGICTHCGRGQCWRVSTQGSRWCEPCHLAWIAGCAAGLRFAASCDPVAEYTGRTPEDVAVDVATLKEETDG